MAKHLPSQTHITSAANINMKKRTGPLDKNLEYHVYFKAH
jgi:hypothetical protein